MMVLQWMTAGKGVLHSEMFHGNEESHGLQLWVNLSKQFKMIDPAYQELLAKDIPCASKDGTKVKVIAGKSMGVCVSASFRSRQLLRWLKF